MNTNHFRANYHSKSKNIPRFVYALVDPRDSRIRYVGCSYEPGKRLARQLDEARKRRKLSGMIKNPENMPPRLRWLNVLDDINERPIVVILEQCEYERWRERENHWIIKLHEAGAELTNVRTAAGYDNIKHPDYKRRVFTRRGYRMEPGY